MNADQAQRAREALDRRFEAISGLSRFARPRFGWIKAIREALGMTTAQLAARLEVSQPSISGVEASEGMETIRLDTLRRVADALGCDLVYALVPRKPLETMVRERASVVAASMLAPVRQTMALEGQAVDPALVSEDRQLEIAARQIRARDLWDEPDRAPRKRASTKRDRSPAKRR
ncbi:MAG: mobile mystery protein A [Alphaproteobacteria bacterium]|nr:mobile mystery protein A [Alphaproteobacteria bacterium]